MEIKNAYAVKRLPRIVTRNMKTARGGYLQGYDRRGKHYMVDTVASHAVKTNQDILQKNGVCLPINRIQQRLMASAQDAMKKEE